MQNLTLHRIGKPNCKVTTKQETPPLCSICNRTFKTSGSLKNHRKSCLKALEDVRCPVCGKMFKSSLRSSSSSKLNWHLKDVHKPRSDRLILSDKYICKGCGQHFQSQKILMKQKANSDCKSISVQSAL